MLFEDESGSKVVWWSFVITTPIHFGIILTTHYTHATLNTTKGESLWCSWLGGVRMNDTRL